MKTKKIDEGKHRIPLRDTLKYVLNDGLYRIRLEEEMFLGAIGWGIVGGGLSALVGGMCDLISGGKNPTSLVVGGIIGGTASLMIGAYKHSRDYVEEKRNYFEAMIKKNPNFIP